MKLADARLADAKLPGLQLPNATGTRSVGAAKESRTVSQVTAPGKARTRSDRSAPPASTSSAAAPSDAGAALLATVLQWTQQQQRDPAPIAPAHTDADADAANTGAAPAGPEIAAPATAAAISAPGADAAPARQSSAGARAARPELAVPIGAAGTAPANENLSAAALPDAQEPGDPLSGTAPESRTDHRAPAARGADDELPNPLPIATTDSAGAATAAPAGVDMAAALRAAGAAAAGSNGIAANAAPVERSIAVPMRERHWPAALATQVLIMSSDKLQAATLRLTPEHLGPVEVRIDMRDTQVNVNFTAAHAETRAALEQAMPQLRSVLEGAGLTLGQASVQQQARRESHNAGPAARPAADLNDAPEVVAAVTRARGMIDEFA